MPILEKLPLVSIIITSFNRDKWIEKAIQSVIDQDYENLEIIISDNNSTDNSDKIIKKFCTDKRVRYTRNDTNIGMLSNFKKASEALASGLLVAYVSSDDYLVNSHFISEAVAKFKEYNNLIVFSAVSKNYHHNSKTEAHNTSYNYKVNHHLFNKLIKGNVVFDTFQHAHILNFGGSVFYRNDLLASGIFSEPNTTFADLQTILLLSLKGDFYFSDKVSYIQTFHDNNSSGAYADAEKSLLNLSFAEIPFEAARKINFIKEADLNNWFSNILKPFIFRSMIAFLKNDKNEYKKYVGIVSKKYPKIYQSIIADTKWPVLKIIYSNGFLTSMYKKYNFIKSGKK